LPHHWRGGRGSSGSPRAGWGRTTAGQEVRQR
jgi:hypothetical protein